MKVAEEPLVPRTQTSYTERDGTRCPNGGFIDETRTSASEYIDPPRKIARCGHCRKAGIASRPVLSAPRQGMISVHWQLFRNNNKNINFKEPMPAAWLIDDDDDIAIIAYERHAYWYRFRGIMYTSFSYNVVKYQCSRFIGDGNVSDRSAQPGWALRL